MECSITKDDLIHGAWRAFEKHMNKKEVKEFKENFDFNVSILYFALLNGTYTKFIGYVQLEKTNKDGKERHVDSPNLITRIYQHTFLDYIEPRYYCKDNSISFNCKKGYGITSKDEDKSLMHRVKHYFYDCSNIQYCMIIDQRQCYAHVKTKVFRRMLKKLTSDKFMIDFAVNVCMVNGRLPIGTPTSPFAHHIVMLDFDHFVQTITPYVSRFADDVFMGFEDKHEAQTGKWRVKNYWWYELGMRAKRKSGNIRGINEAIDYCGYVFHRNEEDASHHNKGYVTIRRRTADAARQCKDNKSYASYFGLMKHADCYNLMLSIEDKNMKLKTLTEKIKINRELDAPHIDIKDIDGVPITIYDYEIRKNKGEDNWAKFLIGIEQKDESGELTGKISAHEFHGNYQGLIQWVRRVESQYSKKELLPIEEAVIVNQCGYIFQGSTNQIKYIEDEEYKIC